MMMCNLTIEHVQKLLKWKKLQKLFLAWKQFPKCSIIREMIFFFFFFVRITIYTIHNERAQFHNKWNALFPLAIGFLVPKRAANPSDLAEGSANPRSPLTAQRMMGAGRGQREWPGQGRGAKLLLTDVPWTRQSSPQSSFPFYSFRVQWHVYSLTLVIWPYRGGHLSGWVIWSDMQVMLKYSRFSRVYTCYNVSTHCYCICK